MTECDHSLTKRDLRTSQRCMEQIKMKVMPELRVQLEQLLKRIGIANLIPDSCDEDLHKCVC